MESSMSRQPPASATLRTTVPRDGDPTAVVRLVPGDALAADDTRGVLLRGSGALRVLLVNGDPQPDRTRDELRFIGPALAG